MAKKEKTPVVVDKAMISAVMREYALRSAKAIKGTPAASIRAKNAVDARERKRALARSGEK